MADGSINIDTKLDTKGAESGIKKLESKLEATSKKAKTIGTNMSKYLTAPILALGGIAFAAADDMDKAYRNIRVGTGAVGDDLEDLKKSFQTVFEGVPNSADEVSNALANLNTFTGATGEELEKLTKTVLDASRMLGEDGVHNSELFGQAMAQWQIPVEDGTQELDKLFQVTQDYGIGLNELTGGLNKYGSVMQNAGYSMDESAEFMGGLNAAGIDVRRTMPGLTKAFGKWTEEGKDAQKEFGKLTKRIQENGASGEDLAMVTELMGDRAGNQLVTALESGAIPAFDKLGDSMADSQGLINDTNEDTKTIGEQFAELKNQAQEGLEPLGRVLLDLAKDAMPPLIEAFKTFAEWIANLSPTTLKIITVIGGLVAVIGPLLVGFGLLVSAFTTILPIITAVGGALAAIVSIPGLIIAAIVALVAAIVIYWDEIWEFTSEIFTAIGEFFVEFWEATTELFFEVLDSIVEFFSESWTWLKETTVEVFTSIGEFFTEFWNSTIEFFTEIVSSIIDFFINSWNTLKDTTVNVFQSIFSFFSSIFNSILGVVSTITNSIKSVISGVWNGIKTTTSKVFNGIKNFFSRTFSSIKRIAEKLGSAFSSVWDSIKEGASAIARPIAAVLNGVMGGIESVINGISGAVNALPSFDIPSWVPGLGGKTFGLPNIPTVSLPRVPSLDVGTNFVANDGLAMLHAGEAVVPAKHNGPYEEARKNESYNDNAILSAMKEQSRLLNKLVKKSQDVYIDGEKATDVVNRNNAIVASLNHF